MVQDNYALLHGRTVRLNGTSGPFRTCFYGQECEQSEQMAVIAGGMGPHLARLRCTTCGRHLSWLGRKHLDALMRREGLTPLPEDDELIERERANG